MDRAPPPLAPRRVGTNWPCWRRRWPCRPLFWRHLTFTKPATTLQRHRQMRAYTWRLRSAWWKLRWRCCSPGACRRTIGGPADEVPPEQMSSATAAHGEFAETTAGLAEQLQRLAESARDIQMAAKQGGQAVQAAATEMGRVREPAQAAMQRCQRLGESARSIEQIIQALEALADAAALSALNATIQAVNGGEAGRGLASRAGELERLAERSTEAIRQAAALVKALQIDAADTGSLVEQLAIATGEAERQTNLAEKSVGLFGQFARQAAAGAKEVAATADQLAGQARDLRPDGDQRRNQRRAQRTFEARMNSESPADDGLPDGFLADVLALPAPTAADSDFIRVPTAQLDALAQVVGELLLGAPPWNGGALGAMNSWHVRAVCSARCTT